MLGFDATDNPLYGQQESRFFHGYYDAYCYLPLYMFCAQHAAAILKLLVKCLRQQWPTQSWV